MKFTMRYIMAAMMLLAVSLPGYSQKEDFNPITTGVTSLGIAPDARGASMGDLGAATDPDANSQFWNPSKYAFAYSKAAVALNYTPGFASLSTIFSLPIFQAIGKSVRRTIRR